MKDYYKILELDVSATQQEIKKAYRRLALQYHPDKNQGDPYAAAQFTEIKEAYEVLTNPQKKQYYLEQRWFQQSMGRKKTEQVITPVTVLKTALEFDRHVSKLDIHRVDKEKLYQYVMNELISDDIVTRLNNFHEKESNAAIAGFILKNIFVISPANLGNVQSRLEKLELDESFKEKIKQRFSQLDRQHAREKFMPWLMLMVVILISLVIYFVSKD